MERRENGIVCLGGKKPREKGNGTGQLRQRGHMDLGKRILFVSTENNHVAKLCAHDLSITSKKY